MNYYMQHPFYGPMYVAPYPNYAAALAAHCTQQQNDTPMDFREWPRSIPQIEDVCRQLFLYKERPIVAFVLEGARAFSLASDAIQNSLDAISGISSDRQVATVKLLTQYDDARKQALEHVFTAKCKCEKAFEALSECITLNPADANLALAVQQVKSSQECCQAIITEIAKLQNDAKRTSRKVKKILQKQDSIKPGKKKSTRRPRRIIDTRQIEAACLKVVIKVRSAITDFALAAEAIDASILSVRGY